MEQSFLFKPSIRGIGITGSKTTPESISINSLLFEFNIRTIVVTEYSWNIIRTYQEFIELNNSLHRYMNDGAILSVPPLQNNSSVKNSSADDQLKQLVSYLQDLAEQNDICNNKAFWEFLEVSVLSFDGTSKKRKEGYVNKRTGGRVGNDKKCFNCSKYCRRLQKRWLIVRDNMVGYLSNHMKGNLHEVLMFKGKFEVLKGLRDTGYDDGISITTQTRKFYFRAGSARKMEEWFSEIQSAKKESEWTKEDHRFESSFPIRYNNKVRWFVDGLWYFNEVCESLIKARREVFITDWWLSPELYLKRPSSKFDRSQVCEVLGIIADRGVSVYVHVYKEVSFALTLNSLHTKNALQARNSNIKVVRHPHRSVVGGEFLWSHHEKIICIDQEIAFIGGLDLCYGRMDTSEHKLVDNIQPYFWNGIDYSNVRIADFDDVSSWEKDSLDRDAEHRLPWHDISLQAVGKVAADIALHFIELWNHVMTDITGNYHKDKILLRPKHDISHMKTIKESEEEEEKETADAIDFSDRKPALSVSRSRTSLVIPKIEKKTKNVSRGASESKRINIDELDFKEETDVTEPKAVLIETLPSYIRNSVEPNQSVGSYSDESSSVLNNSGSILMHRRASTQVCNLAYRDKKAKLEEEDEKRLENELRADIKEGDEAWARNLLIPNLKETGEVGKCECQVIRSAGTWSLGLDNPEHSIHTAYLHLIDQADHFIYIENQFFISNTAGNPVKNSIAQAIVERIKIAAHQKEKFKIIVVLPLLPGFTGGVDDKSASVLRIQLHWLYATISRGENSIYQQLLRDPCIANPNDYIAFYGLRNHGVINGTPVTEIVYVHSKMMIVDDDIVIIGSANINDRSQVGKHDSEIAMVISDNEKLQSVLAGRPRSVSKFAYTLRTNIFKEILGISDENLLRDPLSDELNQTIKSFAESNTRIYKDIFRCYPDNEIQSFQNIDPFKAQAKLNDYPKVKDSIRGFLVEFPLHFLHDEDLRIKIFSKEFYIPEESFIWVK